MQAQMSMVQLQIAPQPQAAQAASLQAAQPAQTTQQQSSFESAMQRAMSTAAQDSGESAAAETTPQAGAGTQQQDVVISDEQVSELAQSIGKDGGQQALSLILALLGQDEDAAKSLIARLLEQLKEQGVENGLEMMAQLMGVDVAAMEQLMARYAPESGQPQAELADGTQSGGQTQAGALSIEQASVLSRMTDAKEQLSDVMAGGGRQTQTAHDAQPVQEQQQAQSAQQSAMTPQAGASQQQTPDAQEAQTMQQPQTTQQTQQTQPQQAAADTANAGQSPVDARQIETASYKDSPQQGGQTDGDAQMLMGQAQFQQAVRTAARQLNAQQPAAGEKQLTDEQTLAQTVDNAALLRGALAQGTAQVTQPETVLPPQTYVDAQAIADQLKLGAQQAMQLETKQFVMTLKPDGLGSITVRLVEDGAKLTLSIMAMNTDTQKLLSAQLPELQQAMKPLNVEVMPVQGQQEGQGAQSDNLMHNNNSMSSEDFAEHQHQAQQQQANSSAQRQPEDDPLLSATPRTLQSSDGLDTYI